MEKIKKKFDELIQLIKDSKLYNKYQRLLIEMNKDQELNNLISEIKELQQQIVIKEHQLKPVKELEIKLKKKYQQLYKSSLYKEYLKTTKELNIMIQHISNRIQIFFN
ncbi:MAG: YlbF family regulator [Bacilli bacterium]|jgi:cell fate (sporulation/competence/biofilm development) regulator YmcA (YheA/YmcA/DUF963 family)|nr:YlbF family regulator [Bacilli bacterium]